MTYLNLYTESAKILSQLLILIQITTLIVMG